MNITVQEKVIAFRADSKLYHIARVKLVVSAKKRGISLRQSYEPVEKEAFIKLNATYESYYNGRTLKSTIDNVEKNAGIPTNDTFIYQSYRGKSNHPDDVNVCAAG